MTLRALLGRLRKPRLSGRLLLLTMLFVLIGEVVIYVPSIARFRLSFLEARLDAGHLATMAREASPDGMLSEDLEARLLARAMVEGVVLRRSEASMLMLSSRMPPMIDATYDLRKETPFNLVVSAFRLMIGPAGAIRVLGTARDAPGVVVEVVLKEAYLREQMFDFSRRIFTLSLVISLITATLVFLSLQWLMVRPMRAITLNLARFRREPENVTSVIASTDRSDEVGMVQQELSVMQRELRAALIQKARLAALGAAVSKINHDLRNSLASAMLVSDRLAQSDDPTVRKVTPRLIAAIDRAIALCANTLSFTQAPEPKLDFRQVALRPLIAELGDTVGLPVEGGIRWTNEVSDSLSVRADPTQLYRILLNLARNSVEAMNGQGELRVLAEPSEGGVAIDVIDTGPGLAPKALERLFQPFAGSAKPGGTGLGLAIARELARFHGGDIILVKSTPEGTRFRVWLPNAQA